MAADRFLERAVFYPGQTIVREGEEGTRAFLIDSGEVRVMKKMPNGGEAIIATLGKGGVFGEMALIDNLPRMASVVATRQTVCYVISRRDFQKRLAASDPFIRGLLTVFVSRIRQVTQGLMAEAPSSLEDEDDDIAMAS